MSKLKKRKSLDNKMNMKNEVKKKKENVKENVKVKEKMERRIAAAPWENTEEFRLVYEWLFGDNSTIALKEKALTQINIWHLRRSIQCPAAVLGTMVLLEVHLKDQQNPNCSEEDMSIFYASAFTRFFNYMSSIMQTHSGRTLYQTADDLGLKDFIVDLRHTCSHGIGMPPLSTLRSSTRYCLSWLHDYYWYTQKNVMLDVNASQVRRRFEVGFDHMVNQHFAVFDAALEAVVAAAAHTLAEARSRISHSRFLHLKSYCNQFEIASIPNVFEHVANNLLRLSTSYNGNVKYINQSYVEGVMGMQYFFSMKLLQDSKEHHLVRLIECTQPLFRMLVNSYIIDDLFVALLDTIETRYTKQDRCEQFAFWALKIAQGFAITYTIKCSYKEYLKQRDAFQDVNYSNTNIMIISDKVRELLAYDGIDRRKNLIFCDTLIRPWLWTFDRNFLRKHLYSLNEYSASIIKCLLPLIVPKFDKTNIELLTQLIDNYLPETTEVIEDVFHCKNGKRKSPSHRAYKIYTYNDYLSLKKQKLNEFLANSKVKTNGKSKLKLTFKTANFIKKFAVELKEQDENRSTTVATEPQNYGIWSITSDDKNYDWVSSPLGCLPWQ